MTLDAVQLRVLGSLIEKEITTPENYPLSLNALLNACNQRSSRDPVLDLTEEQVRQALHALEDLAFVSPVRDSRVPKYEHRARTVLNLRRDETAILCLLFLRGPQTPGELRSRADRLFQFDDLAAVQSTLERLASRSAEPDPASPNAPATGPLTVMLARQPGARESRFAHLLGGTPDASQISVQSFQPESPATASRADLESRLADLTAVVQDLLQRVHTLEVRVAPKTTQFTETTDDAL